MRSFAELDLWGYTKLCGDHYKCTLCNDDIRRDVTLEEAGRLAKLIGGDLDSDLRKGVFDGWD